MSIATPPNTPPAPLSGLHTDQLVRVLNAAVLGAPPGQDYTPAMLAYYNHLKANPLTFPPGCHLHLPHELPDI